MVKITIESKEFVADLKDMTDVFVGVVKSELLAATTKAKDNAAQDAPIFSPPVSLVNQRRGGSLKQSFDYSPKELALSYEISNRQNYAAYQEFGTGTGFVNLPDPDIQALAATFIGQGIRQVNMKPQPFLFENVKNAFNEFLEIINKYKSE